jgi:poly(A) polymerase/tRNA nucleotidyltransferase (CCA-adding enzyme)
MSPFSALLADPALAPILAALPRARLVGGCVRDTLAGRPVADIDIATPDPPDASFAALQAAGLRVIPTGVAHGTVTAISQSRQFEITTLRRDETTDGRHAQVAWTDDFQEDAARRDFTFNAMSVDQAGTLHDPFGGAADLQAGRVRFVGEPARRIAEDFLRILRFFRFYARYGTGPADPDATAAIAAATAGLARLSAERVWAELRAILVTPEPMPAIALMQELGVLDAVLPDASNTERLARVIAAGAPADPILRLAALLAGDANRLAERLRLSTKERDALLALSGGPVPQHGDDGDELRRKLAADPADILIGRVWLAGHGALADRLLAEPRPVFPLEGRDALALGVVPGPEVGGALRAVRAWWLAGGCKASREACLERLRKSIPA